MAYVYRHIRKDTNDVFYVGIGKHKKRAFSRFNRNKHWYNVVNKHGYVVDVTHEDVCWEEACSIEKYLISFYGRRDLGLGTLVNLTDGGDGVLTELNRGEFNAFYGRRHTDKTKDTISRKAKERFKDPSRIEFIRSVHKGKKLTQEQIDHISKRTRRGNNPRAKRVIDTSTGIVYDCVSDAADAVGVKPSTLRCQLNGNRPNRTTFKNYAE